MPSKTICFIFPIALDLIQTNPNSNGILSNFYRCMLRCSIHKPFAKAEVSVNCSSSDWARRAIIEFYVALWVKVMISVQLYECSLALHYFLTNFTTLFSAC
ncbi:unnamed protein product [Moneuplotes crassus]|uniref:Uncharacterized protein n=1 Tax=Euplotes crassus TaxID=5936 RepID=A0AAD1Y8H0_EUPCR|nr:unnamed protein product [Moneuplotes crassus]